MINKIELSEVPENNAVTIRKIITFEELPEVLGSGYAEILKYLDDINHAPSNVPFALYHNTHMDKLDVEFGYPVAVELKGEGEIKGSKTPSGLIASCIYKGPYNKMEPVYNEITEWIRENGYKAAGAVFENYLNDPQTTPPEELLTRVGFILEKIRPDSI